MAATGSLRMSRAPSPRTIRIVKATAAPHPLGSRALPPARARPAGALGHARCREDRRRIVPGLERDLAHPAPGRSSWRDLLLAARHLGGPGAGVLDATPAEPDPRPARRRCRRRTATLHPNHAGPAAHVANASFAVDPRCRGRGVGRQLAEDTLARARAEGYRAMQFNAVVETNEGAVALWKSMGFRVLTTVPEAFLHPGRYGSTQSPDVPVAATAAVNSSGSRPAGVATFVLIPGASGCA